MKILIIQLECNNTSKISTCLKNTLRYVRAIRTMYIFSSFTLHYVRAIAILKNNHIFTEIFSNWISHDNYLISLLYSIIMDILDFMDYIEFIEFIDYIKTRLYSWKYFSSWLCTALLLTLTLILSGVCSSSSETYCSHPFEIILPN